MRSILLIGPYGVGKSTVGQLLAQALKQRQYSLDDAVWSYYSEVGLTSEGAAAVGEFDSAQWHPYHTHAVKRFLQDHAQEVCVLDLGAGHVLVDGPYRDEMQSLFALYDVVLLLPSPDIALSMQDLRERNNTHERKKNAPHTKWNACFLDHPSSYQLAKTIIYTKDKTPEETCQEILTVQRIYR